MGLVDICHTILYAFGQHFPNDDQVRIALETYARETESRSYWAPEIVRYRLHPHVQTIVGLLNRSDFKPIPENIQTAWVTLERAWAMT